MSEDLPEEARQAVRDPAARVGRFLRVRKLGEGGMGEVWKAWDIEMRRWIALKFLKGGEPEELALFKREAQLAGQLSHPNIAAIYEVGESGGRHFIAMQYIEGKTLARLSRDELPLVVRMLRDAALAVHAAHEAGIVHRDLKPDNIMVEGTSPSKMRAFVMDFGLARSTIVDHRLSKSGMMVGTPSYMSPEQARGDRVDARSDVYSLGATLYELQTGGPPFFDQDVYALVRKIVEREPVSVSSLWPKADRNLETITLKCLEKDPRRRYESALRLAEELGRWLDGEAILARPPSAAYRLAKFVRRGRAVILAGLIGLAAVAALAGAVVPRWLSEARERKKKEAALVEERSRREREALARDRARPHLDAGREELRRLDLLLTSDDWTPAQAERLAEDARAEFRRALDACPDLAEAWLETARSYRMLGRNPEAEAACSEAIRANASLATAYLERGLIRTIDLMRRKVNGDAVAEADFEEIGRDLGRVTEWSRDRRELALAEGILFFVRGDKEAAMKRLDEYAKDSVADAAAWYWIALVRFLESAPAPETEEILTKAIRYRPRDPDFRGMRGLVRTRRGDIGGALEDYDAAVRIAPNRSFLYVNRGNCRSAKNDLEGALADFNRALELRPEDAVALNNRGNLQVKRREWARAIEDYDVAIRLQPRVPDYYVNRGNAKKMSGDSPGALADYTRALDVEPRFLRAFIQRGNLHQAENRFDEAIADFGRAIDLDSEFAGAWGNRGTARALKGDYEGSIADFTRALELKPDAHDIRVNRAASHHRSKRWAKAVEDYEELLRRAPKNWPDRSRIEELLKRARNQSL